MVSPCCAGSQDAACPSSLTGQTQDHLSSPQVPVRLQHLQSVEGSWKPGACGLAGCICERSLSVIVKSGMSIVKLSLNTAGIAAENTPYFCEGAWGNETKIWVAVREINRKALLKAAGTQGSTGLGKKLRRSLEFAGKVRLLFFRCFSHQKQRSKEEYKLRKKPCAED